MKKLFKNERNKILGTNGKVYQANIIGAGSIVKVAGVEQNEVNFTSDPQIQITTEVEARKQDDINTLTNAKQYIDTEIEKINQQIVSTNGQVTTNTNNINNINQTLLLLEENKLDVRILPILGKSISQAEAREIIEAYKDYEGAEIHFYTNGDNPANFVQKGYVITDNEFNPHLIIEDSKYRYEYDTQGFRIISVTREELTNIDTKATRAMQTAQTVAGKPAITLTQEEVTLLKALATKLSITTGGSIKSTVEIEAPSFNDIT